METDTCERCGPYSEGGKIYWPRVYGDRPLSPDEVAGELADYAHVLREVPKVYEAVTGGKLSKPNYFAQDVIAAFEDHLSEAVDTAIDELDNEPA